SPFSRRGNPQHQKGRKCIIHNKLKTYTIRGVRNDIIRIEHVPQQGRHQTEIRHQSVLDLIVRQDTEREQTQKWPISVTSCRKNSCHDRIIIKQPENQNNGQHHHTKYEVNHVPLADKSWIVWIFFLIKVKKIYTKRGRQRCQRGIRGGKSGRRQPHHK